MVFSALLLDKSSLAPEIDAHSAAGGSLRRADQEQSTPGADVEHCFLSLPLDEIQNAIAAAELARFSVIDHQQTLQKRYRARKNNDHPEPHQYVVFSPGQ